MKRILVLEILLSAAALLSAATITEDLPNLHRPQFNIMTAGQPTNEGFYRLSQSGVRTVINVLPDAECVSNEAAVVVGNNMIYQHFPFELSDFRRETFEQFGDLLYGVPKPVLIHCSTGNHVGGLWLGYRVLVENVPIPIAIEEARMIGMKPALENKLVPWLLNQNFLVMTGQERKTALQKSF
jgi:uncharacterized protein (TIGR01244 family)